MDVHIKDLNMERKECGTMIKQLHDALEKCANNALRSQDLTMAQVSVLIELYLSEEKQMSLKELERALHVAQSTAAGIVMRLEQKGFVESFGDSSDKRVKIVRITPTGEACCLQADAHMAATQEKILAPLTEVERTVFITLLKKICDNVTEPL